MKHIKKSITVNGKTFIFETGNVAFQASAAVLGRLGDTMVLATVVGGGKRPDLDYFPLTVEYVERLYAGGRIKGSRWVKREGRPSDDAILTARLIDRSIRPLFPKNFTNEVQVVVTVLSVDGENDPDVLALLTVSIALSISPIPWNGPLGVVRIGRVLAGRENGGGFLINPTTPEKEFSDVDLVVANTKDKTIMMEMGGLQVPEEVMLAAVKRAKEETVKLVLFVNEFAKEAGLPKAAYEKSELPDELILEIDKSYKKEIDELVINRASNEGGAEHLASLAEVVSSQKEGVDKGIILKILDYLFKKRVRKNILEKGERIDGRKADEIRPISSSVSVLPRTHGSAIFQRGQTQALTVVTLGAPSLEQLIESAEGEETKRYIHHYSFPPYSVGETGRIGFSSRREIGHGALAEKALLPVIPKEDVFPYTIRVVSEILSSNGSTSMASTCGSTLSLMDAGVPITTPVSGIAMGMMSDEKGKYVILSDIMGIEDFAGDMDFKIAGTELGITAVQLDVKLDGITDKIIEDTLTQARVGRLFILEKMLSVLKQSRATVSQFAPKIQVLHVPVEKIGEVIGPGGKIIRAIIAQSGATVDVEDDGSVSISAPTQEAVDKAVKMVEGLTRQLTVGESFEGEVKRILPFGAFVEVSPGKEGMVHVSQMSTEYVDDPAKMVSIGQKVKVRVIEIDDMGRVNLSMLPEGVNAPPREARPPRPMGRFDNSDRRMGGRTGRPFVRRPGFGGRSGPSTGGRSGFSSGRPGFPTRDRFRKPSY
ncbi:polyribonucleotide nucleotidyltransferase [Candidatus Microgenomates bacterium]|nr:polyribonucleotide nucleotidyltransferase [Candidatus Microgenomates bacterium]